MKSAVARVLKEPQPTRSRKPGRRFPLPVRHERGEGEGLPNKDGLLSPTLSSIVPLEEREQASFAFNEEFYLTRPRRGYRLDARHHRQSPPPQD